MIDPKDAAEWFTAAKTGVDALKAAWNMLPKGKDKDAIAHKIEEAEDALKRSDARLAKALGYKLCQCTFPPQIMLWKEAEKSFACPNNECGRTEFHGTVIDGLRVSPDFLRFAQHKKP
jgi:hypothetical protein